VFFSKLLFYYRKKRYENVNVILDSSSTNLDCSPGVARDDIAVTISIGDVKTAFSTKNITQESASVTRIREKQKELASTTIHYNEIVTSYDEIVVITGVPGAGKTFLAETLVHRWSKGEMWQNEPDFDFVFIVHLRELGQFQNDKEITAEKILSHLYPDYSFCEPKTLLILEGFDELLGKETLDKHENKFSPYTRAIFNLLNPNNSKLQCTRLVTSRPGCCQMFTQGKLKPKETNLRTIEIAGFSETGIAQYVRRHFPDESEAEGLLAMLKKNPILWEMMLIPFYCQGICFLLKNKVKLNDLGMTKTALYCNLFMWFIGKHGTRDNNEIDDLVEDEEFKKWCVGLAKLAFDLEKNKKINFEEKDLPKDIQMADLIKNTGMVIKIKKQDSPACYQFLHYSFHEFLVALHMFITGENCLLNYDISIFLAGLIGGGLNYSKSPNIVMRLAKAVVRNVNPSFSDVLQRRCFELSQHSLFELFFEYQNPFRDESLEITIGEDSSPSAYLKDYFEKNCKTGREFFIKRIALESVMCQPRRKEYLQWWIDYSKLICKSIELFIAIINIDEQNFEVENMEAILKLVELGSFKFDKVVFYTLISMSVASFNFRIHELEANNRIHEANNRIHEINAINKIQEANNKIQEANNKIHKVTITFVETIIQDKIFNNDTRIPVLTSYGTSDFIQLCKDLPAENCSLDFRHYPKIKGFTQILRIIAKEVKISELTIHLKLQDYANRPMELIEEYDFVEVLNIYLVCSYDESFINEQKEGDETMVPNLSAFDQFKNSISSLMIERKDKNERLKKINLFNYIFD